MSKKLFMLMLGCCPPGRHTEQHDIFFGIADTLKDLIPDIKAFWPEAKGRIHIDAWREVNQEGGFKIEMVDRAEALKPQTDKLFFINLGGYIRGLFDEPHKKLITVQPTMAQAIAWAKQTEFFKTVHFDGATSHVDDKFGIDVDDAYEIEDILPADQKAQYAIRISKTTENLTDQMHLGYFKLDKLP